MRAGNEHGGHRERMIEKLSQNAALTPHEYLEILLFSALPRIDTRPLAHRLLQELGDLSGVLTASVERLQKTEGIGKQTAAYIHTVGKLIEQFESVKEQTLPAYFEPFHFLAFVKNEYAEIPYEVLDAYLLNSDNQIVSRRRFSVENVSNVRLRTDEFIECLMEHRPSGVVLVHNHPSGEPNPSAMDELTTKKCQAVCSMHNVLFCEHVIFCKEGAFSYYISGRMQELSKAYALEQLFPEEEITGENQRKDK